MALYVLWGERFWARKKLKELLLRAREKKSAIFKLIPDVYEPLENYLSGNVFGERVCLVGEYLLSSPDYTPELKNILDALVSSDHIILLLEAELSAEWQERFKRAGAKLEEFKNPGEAKFLSWTKAEAEKLSLALAPGELKILISDTGLDPWAILAKLERLSLEPARPAGMTKAFGGEPNYFNFADAASGKNKYQALRLLRHYIEAGFGAEEAFWRLWWKVKTLRMVDSGRGNLGLHPFVQKKARDDLRNFSSEELNKLSYEMMDLFSEVRRGEANFGEGLEKLLLKI